MKTSKELREERGQLVSEMDSLLQTAEKEKRELAETEQKRFDELKIQISGFEKRVVDAEFVEEQRRLQAARDISATSQKKEDRLIEQYSFVKAIRSQLPNQKLEGYELEMDQEARKEARTSGFEITGVGIPQMIVRTRNRGEQRTILAGTETEPIPTIKQGFIDMLMARLAVQKLGAQFLTGLNGNLSIPRLTGQATAAWKNENAEASESTHTFDSVDLTPKKLTTYTQYSKQMMLQSSVDIEALVRGDLVRMSAQAVDTAAINGSGVSPEPAGILQVSGIGSVAIGANGGFPLYEHLVGLVKEVAIDNADVGSLGFLTNPAVRAKLQVTQLDAGSGLFVWPMNSQQLMAYATEITTLVPSTLTKGNAASVCSAVIFGNFNDLLVAQWGGLDLIVDPYTVATYGYVRIIIHSFWDIDVRHAQSFAAIKDALTTL